MVSLPSIFNSAKKSSTFLTIDIGTEAVKCMLFEAVDDNGVNKANLVGIGKESLPYGATRAGVIVEEEVVLHALDACIAKATAEVDTNVSEAIFGVSGSLCFGLMTTVRLTRGIQEPITQKELDRIYDKIHEAAYNQAQNDLAEKTGSYDVDIDLVTSSVVYIDIDGKKIKDPVGRDGQRMEIALFTAFTPSYHIAVLSRLAKKLKLNILAIGSEMYALVSSLHYSKGKHFDCVVMDIGGEITDVGVVFGGGIVATRNLSVGGRHFTQQLSEKLRIPYIDAENKKCDYSFGRFNEDTSLAIQDNLNDVLQVWLSGVELLFTDFTGVKTFPSQIYLTGGGAELPDIMSSITKEPWTKSIPFKSVPEFSKLSVGDLVRVNDVSGSAHSLSDVLPAALSIIYLEMFGYLDE